MASGDVVYSKNDMQLLKTCQDSGQMTVKLQLSTGGTIHYVTVEYGGAGGTNSFVDASKTYDVIIKEH